MTFEQTIASLPVSQWKTRRAIVFDYYDGPRSGICCLELPAVEFWFDLLDERYNEDGLDDRLYRINELSPGTVAEVDAMLRVVGSPIGPVWAPIWRFSDDESRRTAEQRLKNIEASKRPTTIVIHSQDMQDFLGRWDIAMDCHDIADWFDHLNIPPAKPTSAA